MGGRGHGHRSTTVRHTPDALAARRAKGREQVAQKGNHVHPNKGELAIYFALCWSVDRAMLNQA
jgi:hypothetical protein